MFDFHFSIPTEIYFGKGCEERAGALMSQYASRVLMVYGSERIFQMGLGEKLVSWLEEAGCTVFRLGGVKPNASTDYIRSAIELVRRKQIDGILAIGGGSVMDSAKAISAGAYFEGDIVELYSDPQAEPSRFLPVGAVVTMPATASESNEMSVISDSI